MGRKKAFIILLSAVAFIATLWPMPVHADPHAVFYTKVGQQQLFFNVLAALNQADYVEPANSSPYSRETLLNNRTAKNFPGPSPAEYVDATKTELAAVLTRNITLEGNDVWSAYIAYMDALEADRRRNLVELTRVFCTLAYGAKDCKNADNEDSPQVAEAREERAYIVDPVKEAKEADSAADAAFLSAEAEQFDQEQRKLSFLEANIDRNHYRPYDANVAELTNRAIGNQIKEGILGRWVSGVVNFKTGSINPQALDMIDEEGYIDTEGYQYASDLTQDLGNFLSVGNQLLAAHIGYREAKESIDGVKRKDGLLAQTFPVPQASNGKITTIEEKVSAPVAVNAAQIDDSINSLSDAEVQKYAASSQQNIQGDKKYTEPVSTGDREAAGISTVAGATTGRVLQASTTPDPQYGSGLDLPQGVGEERDPEAIINLEDGPTSFTREPTSEDLLYLLAGGRTHGGCGCSLDALLRSYGP